jgi:gamma-glutamyltranspeptidase/glutathione hydrolase
MHAFQAYIFDIVQAIYLSYPETQKIFASRIDSENLLMEGEILRQPELADFMECLAKEGEALFYQGEVAQSISQLCSESGGHMTLDDFKHYQITKHNPLNISYRHTSLLSNPAPSSGGTLIAFALKLLETVDLSQYSFGSAAYLDLLAQVQRATDQARVDIYVDNTSHHTSDYLLNPDLIASYQTQIKPNAYCSRGTTHISIMDQLGNIASLTTSNGEGCGLFIPGTGVMLNNMLGEQDLNPHGFHNWAPNRRMTSMMAPSIVFLPNDKQIVLGSGGSNRLRTAILQVLLNLIDFDMPLHQAVSSPRIHFEKNHLSVEGGFNQAEIELLVKNFPNHKVLENRNLFFGGTHSVCRSADEFTGVGDPRRGGYAIALG